VEGYPLLLILCRGLSQNSQIDERRTTMSEITTMRELNIDELDVVAGGQGLIGGPGSLIDITTTGLAVQGILGSLGAVLDGLMVTSSKTGQGVLGGLLGGL
jgi:hypothetical protein